MHNTVLVTGANGLLGSNIVKFLTSKHYKVKILVRKGSSLISLHNMDYMKIEGDITNNEDVDNAVKGCDYIIHSAANTSQLNRLSNFISVNINATMNLIKAGKKYNVKRFIYVSTANCFTNGSIENPGTENSSFMPWLKGSGYAFSKYIAQKAVLNSSGNGLPAIVVAPTFIVGPGDAKLSSGRLLFYGFRKRIIFFPPGGKSIIDAEHAADAIVNAIEMGKLGSCYLLAGENNTYKKIFGIIRKSYNKKALLIQIPSVFLRIAGNFSVIIQRLFNVKFVFDKTNQKLLCLDNYFNAEKAQNELLLKPTNTEEAIQKAYSWYKKMNYI